MNKDVTTSFEDYCKVIREFSPCMNDYLYVYDLKNDKYYISENALERFKVPSAIFENVVETHELFVYGPDLKVLKNDLTRLVRGEADSHNIVYRWLGKDDNPIWINCKGRVIREDNVPSLMVGCVNEIGKRQSADNISGLLDSSAIKVVLDGFFKTCPTGYVMRIGIDDFSDINEKFGADYGDYVLKKVAECISDFLLPGQEVYRASGDEYLICDFLGGTRDEVQEVYRKIRVALDQLVASEGYKAVFTISAGVILGAMVDKPDYKEIMRLSQYALHEAKVRGKNQAYYYDPKDYERFAERQRVLSELKKSVSRKFAGFSLFYQPICDAQGTMYGAEALLRFKDTEGVIIPPVEFIPILEESGLIIPVGKYVLEEAVKTCKEIQKKRPQFKVSINLSSIQIMKSAILEEITSVLEKNDLSPDSILVELTESTYIEETPSIQNVWKELSKKGIFVAVDDFGTGYSNLQNISKLSPNIVKIDHYFTAKAMHEKFEYQLMESIISLIHALNLKVCVEGVETEEDMRKISQMNPDFIQGYYFGRPCDKEDFWKGYVDK